MKFSEYPYILCLLSFVGALVLSVSTIPRIMYVAQQKKLFDVPDNARKIHKEIIPNLGGVAIFLAFIIVTSLTINPTVFTQWNYFAAACLMLFVTGIKDDLVTLPPYKKLVSQLSAAFIVVFFADVRLTSLHGFLGIHELDKTISTIFSIVGCMFLTNAFNLIDGIDGLAGTIGMIASFVFGILLYAEGNYNVAIMSFALMGAIMGFLRYNISPAKIFMGDTGSMVIGFSLAVIAILFVKSFTSGAIFAGIIHSKVSALLIALAVLFIPIFDTFRVFTTRSLKGYSPFRADRTHLHHYLLDLGFTHRGTVSVLLTANLFIMAVCLIVQDYNINLAIGSLLFVAFGLFAIMYTLRKKTEAAKKPASNIAPLNIKGSVGAGIENGTTKSTTKPIAASKVSAVETTEVSAK